MTRDAPIPAKLSYGIREAGQALGVSRPTLYRMIGRGELATFKLGSRTLIRRTELDALLDRLSQPSA
ncbi:helix-turn-helix domain-containing protein [Brevundimonas sp.]|uniref:helix-turn-helix domain-containing protein n=1 Tax=Brevundimonas sp. TaxID=1871086 RepID=UPI0028A76A4A|nr:helix-turn-helix domain-containing protein [Brevundimonas sp.]